MTVSKNNRRRLFGSSRRPKATPRRPLGLCQLGFETLEERRLLAPIVPPLDSNPGAAQTLYLDFDGSAPFLWDGAGTGTPYVVRGPSPDDAPIGVPAFTTDADADNFADFTGTPFEGTAIDEIAQIKRIHAWVSEKFSPFTINVTTVNPNVVVDSQNMTVLIGGASSDWYGKAVGGVAPLDGFFDGRENTGFAFSGNPVKNGISGDQLDRYLGENIAHEAAHMVGLEHQRQLVSLTPFVVDEYFDGDAIRAPIMGGSSNNSTARGIWWITNNPSPSWPGQNSPDPQQDDLLTLTQDAPQRLFFRSNGFDIPEMVFNPAGVLTQIKSVIAVPGEVDGFRFQATGTRASFQVNNAKYGGMLAPTASIRISGTSTLIPISLTLAQNSATIEATNLTPGANYVLLVAGQGHYGDVGQYSIDGTRQQFTTFDAASGILNVRGLIGNNNVTLRSNSFTNSLIVDNSLNGGPTASQSFPLNAVNSVVVFLGNGDDTLNVAGLVHADNSTINVSSNLGGGTDILRLGASGNNFTTFNVSRFAVEWVDAGVRTSRVLDSTAERLELIGTNDHDVFSVNSQDSVSRLFAYGNAGNDRMVVGPGVVRTFSPEASFIGGLGTDALEIAASTIEDPQEWYFFNEYVSRKVPNTITGLAFLAFDAGVENVSLVTGVGADFIKVYEVLAGKSLNINGNAGADLFEVGENTAVIPGLTPTSPFSQTVRGAVAFNGGDGSDRLEVDDRTYLSVGNYAIDSIGIRNLFTGAGQVRYDRFVEHIDFYGRNGETTTFTTVLANQNFRFFNGTGNGIGRLIVDDRSFLDSPVEMDVYADRIITRGGPLAFVTEYGLQYSGYESLEIYTNNATHRVNVYGTSPDVAPAMSNMVLTMGIGADTVFVQPNADATMSIRGGSPTTAPGDNLRLSLAGVTSPVFTPNGAGAGTYTFGNAAAVNYTGFETASAYLPGDFSGNGIVGPEDYNIWRGSFGMAVVPGTLGDGNGDGIVDAADYVVWRRNLGAGNPAAGAVTSATEPGSEFQSSQPPAEAAFVEPEGIIQRARLAAELGGSPKVAGARVVGGRLNLSSGNLDASANTSSTRPLAFNRWRERLVDRVYEEINRGGRPLTTDHDVADALSAGIYDDGDAAIQVSDGAFAQVTDSLEDVLPVQL